MKKIILIICLFISSCQQDGTDVGNPVQGTCGSNLASTACVSTPYIKIQVAQICKKLADVYGVNENDCYTNVNNQTGLSPYTALNIDSFSDLDLAYTTHHTITINTNNFKKAVVAYTKAAELGFVRGNDFNENLGFAYVYSGDFDNGDKLLSDLVRRRPGDKELIRDVATAFYENKNYDKSLEFCQILLEMDIKDGKALYQAGLCFQKKGMVERGMQMCDKAIELDPSLASLKSKKSLPGM